ncbi:hypothetical protein K1719_044017 [Acacia pycnantha]|nr:hypothetical protein K1719_044017 [Acacia pycnantha]
MGRQPHGFVLKKLKQIWERKGMIDVFNLENDFYLVNFRNHEDYMGALVGGPWVILDAYLSISRWKPEFNPRIEKIESIVAWQGWMWQFHKVPTEEEMDVESQGERRGEQRVGKVIEQWRTIQRNRRPRRFDGVKHEVHMGSSEHDGKENLHPRGRFVKAGFGVDTSNMMDAFGEHSDKVDTSIGAEFSTPHLPIVDWLSVGLFGVSVMSIGLRRLKERRSSLTRVSSDHHPLPVKLCVDSNTRRVRNFRYEVAWKMHEELLSLCITTGGIGKNFMCRRSSYNETSRDVFGRIELRKRRIRIG